MCQKNDGRNGIWTFFLTRFLSVHYNLCVAVTVRKCAKKTRLPQNAAYIQDMEDTYMQWGILSCRQWLLCGILIKGKRHIQNGGRL